jgi:hypothetical protein
MPSEFDSPDFRNPFTALIQHFESNSIRFQADQAGKWVQFYTTCECAAFSGQFQVSANDGTLQVSINFPVMARDCKMRPFVTELLVRINRNLVFGAFDNDVDTGQIGFYAGQLMPADGLDERIIVGLFGKCMSTCDRYFPALMRVMFGGITPADAVYLSELDVHAERIKQADVKTPPTPSPPKSAAKKSRPSRKDPRSKSAQELPGLFDREAEQGNDPRQP